MNVAAMAGIPKEIITNAEIAANHFEIQNKKKAVNVIAGGQMIEDVVQEKEKEEEEEKEKEEEEEEEFANFDMKLEYLFWLKSKTEEKEEFDFKNEHFKNLQKDCNMLSQQ